MQGRDRDDLVSYVVVCSTSARMPILYSQRFLFEPEVDKPQHCSPLEEATSHISSPFTSFRAVLSPVHWFLRVSVS